MSFTIAILRPDDLLNLRVRCVNLRIDTDADGASRLRPEGQADAFLVFVFPPQAITERAYYDSTANYPPPVADDGGDYNNPPGGAPPIIGNPDAPGDAPARISGQSRLVLRLGADARLNGVPLTTAGLLDWSGLELVVSPIADLAEDADTLARQNAPDISPPGELETAIELPYRLFISPTHHARWRHASDPVTHAGRTELWHTAIVRDTGGNAPALIDAAHPEPLRAIWSPDYRPGNPPLFGEDDPALRLTAMAPYDRHQIVILTSDFHHYLTTDYTSYVPSPFLAEQLILSGLGGWLRSRGSWDPPFARRPPRPDHEFPWHDVLVQIPGSIRGGLEVRPNAAIGKALLEHLGGVLAPGAPLRAAPVGAAPPPGAPAAPFTKIPVQSIVDKVDLGVFTLPGLGTQLDLSEWVHVATQARDHYVRIVYEGRLYPFGHRAALVKVTERKFRNFTLANGTTTPVAYMVQRMFIVVRERVRDFSNAAAASLTNDGRAMPLKRVRLTTTVTPTISYPYTGVPPVPGTNGLFWVMVDVPGTSTPTDFPFHAVGTDVAGTEIDFTTPLIFVPNSQGGDKAALNTVRMRYATSGDRRACRTTGQRITLAPREAGSTAETTTVECDALYFQTENPAGATTAEQVRALFCTPRLYKAVASIPAAAAIVGTRTAATIAYYEDYLAQEFASAGGVFATVVKEGPLGGDGMPTLTGDKLGASFSAQRGGGIATPNMAITALSRRHGPLAGDVATAAANTFDPSSFFPKAASNAAMLFGAFALESLVKLPAGGQTMDKDAPKMRVRTEAAPPRIVADLEWKPNVHDVDDLPLVKFIASDHGAPAVLDVKARIERLLDDPVNGAHTQIDGSLTNFRIEFVNAVWVHFDEFAFSSKDGAKPDVSVHLNGGQPITFVGDLDFVESLRNLIPPGLLGDGPSLDINAERVHAGFSVAIPPVSVGVFSLSNIRLGAFVELPFTDGRPLFDFAFAQRQEPFTLAVAILGGTGFFHLQMDTEGMRLLEAALEFGAIASLDIGVASGSVHILAGIYFKLEKKKSGGDLEATLSGYMRMGGELSVLGLVSVSIEFVLSFTYHDGKATGRATLTVKIEIAFFSISVELSVERSFGRESGDPTFDQMLPAPAVWSEYAAAFA